MKDAIGGYISFVPKMFSGGGGLVSPNCLAQSPFIQHPNNLVESKLVEKDLAESKLVESKLTEPVLPLASARAAFTLALRLREVSHVYLPFYTCHCLLQSIHEAGCTHEFYHIDENFLPQFDGAVELSLKPNSILMINNAYSLLSDTDIMAVARRYGAIILDNTHAFYRAPLSSLNIDTIYSCRKYLPTSDGGLLYSALLGKPRALALIGSLEADISYARYAYLLKRYELGANAAYADFRANEEALDRVGLKIMSRLTHGLLECFNYTADFRARTANFALLHERLRRHNLLTPLLENKPHALKPHVGSGALCYPLLLERSLHEALAKEQIYIARFWPELLKLPPCLEKDIAQGMHPLPIDLRLDGWDLRRMVEAILQLLG